MSDRRLFAIVLALLFVITGVVAVAFLDSGGDAPLGSTLAIGILTSLASSMFLAAIGAVIALRPESSSDMWQLDGVVRVASKAAITSEDWLRILEKADTEFYVAGHSLGKWCSASNEARFKNHVRRILESEGRVTLVMLDLQSSQIARLRQTTSVDYTPNIRTSLQVLADLCAELQPAARSRLRICGLRDHGLPYMLVGNERGLVTAAYLGGSNRDSVACLELERPSEAAAAVYDDFHALAKAGVTPTLPPPTPPPASNVRRSSRRGLRGR